MRFCFLHETYCPELVARVSVGIPPFRDILGHRDPRLDNAIKGILPMFSLELPTTTSHLLVWSVSGLYPTLSRLGVSVPWRRPLRRLDRW